MRINGTIIDYDKELRTIDLIYRKKRLKIYFQRANYNRFYKFLSLGVIAVLDVKWIKKKTGKQLTVSNVLKLSKPSQRGPKLLYSFNRIQKDTKSFINSLDNKLFLDFEMSMHPYHKNPSFIQEIIQAGYVLEDKDGNLIEEYSVYIKPTKHKKLSKRTTKFLDLTQEDVDKGVNYKIFYNHFKSILETYNPAIIVWGKNDAISLKDSYKLNLVPSLAKKTRFVNLLKLHKNVFNYKNDLGLKNAYEMYGYKTSSPQRHDALDDAYMTKKVFEGFKNTLNT